MRFLPALLLTAGAAFAQEQRPFIFTPSHNNTVQPIAKGATVQVQLPAGPVDWRVERIDRNPRLTGKTVFASPGRAPGSVAVQVFDFTLRRPQPTVIILRPTRTATPGPAGGPLQGEAFRETFTLTLTPEATD